MSDMRTYLGRLIWLTMADIEPIPEEPYGDWLTGKDVPYTPEYESELEYILGQ